MNIIPLEVCERCRSMRMKPIRTERKIKGSNLRVGKCHHNIALAAWNQFVESRIELEGIEWRDGTQLNRMGAEVYAMGDILRLGYYLGLRAGLEHRRRR